MQGLVSSYFQVALYVCDSLGQKEQLEILKLREHNSHTPFVILCNSSDWQHSSATSLVQQEAVYLFTSNMPVTEWYGIFQKICMQEDFAVRVEKRNKTYQRGSLTHQQENIPFILKNLSSKGALLQGKFQDFQENQWITLDLPLMQRERSYQMRGRVRWWNPKTLEMGVEFLKVQVAKKAD